MDTRSHLHVEAVLPFIGSAVCGFEVFGKNKEDFPLRLPILIAVILTLPHEPPPPQPKKKKEEGGKKSTETIRLLRM